MTKQIKKNISISQSIKSNDWAELEILKDELLDMVEEYFPKIKPMGRNKGRGEAVMIIAAALIGFKKILSQQRTQERERLIEKIKEIIGEDEPLRRVTGGEEIFFGKNVIRNKLRRQQRKRLDDILATLKEEHE